MTLQSDERVKEWVELWNRHARHLHKKGRNLSPVTDLRSHEPPRTEPLTPDPQQPKA